MRFATHDKIIKRFLILALLIPSISWGQGPAYTTQSGAAPEGSVVGEAATATFHRVFGQDGKVGEIDYYVFDVYNHSPGNSALRSALIPGWGQTFNGHNVKGAVLFGAFVGSLLGAVSLNNSANDSFRDYEETGLKDGDKFDSYESKKTQSNILFAAAGLMYVFGIVDAYKNAYKPLWSKNDGFEVVFNQEDENLLTGEVRYNKRF